MTPKKNVSLIIGIAIPAIMIALVALSIWVPQILAPKPQHDFLYVVGDGHYMGKQYVVENGILIKNDVKQRDSYTPPVPRFFVHEILTRKNRPLTFDEAKMLRFYPGTAAPDGYEIGASNDYDGGLVPALFGGYSNRGGLYLMGHQVSKHLELERNESGDYYGSARFLGWINKE